MKRFKILPELPRCNTETQSEQMLLENGAEQTCLPQGCHKTSFCVGGKKKKRQYLGSTIKHNKAGKQGMPALYFAYIFLTCITLFI